jgi:hypothetical protein
MFKKKGFCMKKLRSTHFYAIFCSVLFLFPYTMLSVYKDEVYISKSELHEILENTDRKYVYLGRELSDLYDVMLQVSAFDEDKNSVVWQLKKHIEDGYSIGLHDIVMEALAHAANLLQTKNSVEAQSISDALMGVMDQMFNEALTPIVTELVDEKIDGTRKQSSSYPSPTIYYATNKKKYNNNAHVQKNHYVTTGRVIKVREKFEAFDDAHFKEDVKIDGSLVVEGHTRLHEKLKVFGKAVFKGDVKFDEEVEFEDEVKFEDKVKFEEDVEFEENVLIEGNLTVEGTVNFTGTTVISITDIVIQNLSATDIFVVNLSATDATIANLTVTNCMTSLCVNNLSVVDESVSGTLSVNDAIINNATINNLSVTDIVVTGCLASLCVNNLSVVDESVSGTLSVNDEVVQNLTVVNCMTSLCVNNLSVVDESVSGTLSVNDAIINNATITNLSVTDVVVTGCVVNLCVINLSAVDESVSGTLSVNDEIVQNSTITSLSVTDEIVQNSTITSLSATDAIITNATITNLSATDITATTFSVACELIVGCNIEMVNTTDAAHGNILKGGNRFLSNFGTDNTFIGINAGNFTMGGTENSGFGNNTLLNNTTGFDDVAIGSFALVTNTIGADNDAVGVFSMANNTAGNENVAVGSFTLLNNTTGSGNTALGYQAGNSLTIGNNNVFVGNNSALFLADGLRNVIIGYNAGLSLTTGSDNIYVSNAGIAVESGIIRIGTVATHTAAFIQGIFPSVVGGTGIPVFVDATGQLGTVVSSRKFKNNINDMNHSDSENIYKLHPVTFAYNNDETNTKQYGLIAEEVDSVFPELVVKDEEDQPYTVRYHLLPMLLLNEVQILNGIVQDQSLTINELKEDNKKLNAVMRSVVKQMKTLATH